MTRLLSTGLLLFVVGTQASATSLSGTFRGLGHTTEPAALAVVGAGFFLLGFIRRRTAGD